MDNLGLVVSSEGEELGLSEWPSVVSPAPANRQAEHWRVEGGSIGQRLDAWTDILAATHLAFDVHPTDGTPDSFHGVVTRQAVGELSLLSCAAAPFLGDRSRSVIGTQGEDMRGENVFGFQFVCRGVELVREGSRRLALKSGDVVLWDGLQPTAVEIVEPFFKRTLLFPRERVLAVCPRLADLDALPSLAGTAPARLLVRYMLSLAAEQRPLDSASGAAAASAALELLRAAIEPRIPSSRAATRSAMRAEIRRYVRSHLHDPLLGPASIARSYAMSLRTLHSLFEDTDTSVAGLVRGERLDRCLEDLRRPNGGSVTEIAFRWGFCDAAHFSRVFKRRFAVTPSEIRRAASHPGT